MKPMITETSGLRMAVCSDCGRPYPLGFGHRAPCGYICIGSGSHLPFWPEYATGAYHNHSCPQCAPVGDRRTVHVVNHEPSDVNQSVK